MDRKKSSIWEKLLTFLGGRGREGNVQTVIRTGSEVDVEAELKARSEFFAFLTSAKGRYFLSSFFETVSQEKKRIVEMVDSYKNTFFYQMVVQMLVDDVLSVDPVTNNVVDITTTNENLKPIVEGLQERLDIDGFVSSVIEDVIGYGDYVVRVEHDGRKVVALEDDIDQKDVVVIYKSGRPLFLVNVSSDDEIVEEYTTFLHFSVTPRRLRIKLDKNVYSLKGGRWSEYVRVGKPLFWGCWDLLNSLYVLTVFYPVFAVQKLNATTVIGVRVSPEVPQARAWEIARKYQELLNVYTSVDQYGRVSLADVIDTVGKYKVVPVWGDEKGMIQLADPRLEESFALDVLVDLRKVLCATLGIPYGFLFGSDENVPKIEALKSFSRYVKRVASIQRAIREALTQLVLIECRLQGLYPSVEDIEVRFRNSIISVEMLDRLEFVSGLLDIVNSTVDTVMGIGERLQREIDVEKLVDFLNSYLGMVGLEGVFKEVGSGEHVGDEFEQMLGGEEGLEWEEEEEEEVEGGLGFEGEVGGFPEEEFPAGEEEVEMGAR